MGQSADDSNEEILAAVRARREATAVDCLNFVETYLAAYAAKRTGAFVASLRDQVTVALAAHSTLRKVIIDFWSKHRGMAPPSEAANQPSPLLGFAAFLLALRHELKGVAELVEIDESALADLEDVADRWAEASGPQIETLGRLLANVVHEFENMGPGARIVLLELPVGNSIVVRLLEDMLRGSGLKPTTVTISLSRNDSRSAGTPRKELIAQKLNGLPLTSRDVIVYVDEWVTGSNFKVICEHVTKIVKRAGAHFISAAALAPDADKYERFESFCSYHDKLLWGGQTGDRFRVVFPPLNQGVSTRQVFFWSEHDRLAGYRKAQFFGGIFSSICEVAREMSHDPTMVVAAKNALLEAQLDQGLPGGSDARLWSDETAVVELYRDYYQDFVAWSSQAETIELQSNSGLIENVEDEIEDLVLRLGESLDGRRAKLCALLAVVWLSGAEVDSRCPFPFRHHVPVLLELEPDFAHLHRLFLQAVRSRMGS